MALSRVLPSVRGTFPFRGAVVDPPSWLRPGVTLPFRVSAAGYRPSLLTSSEFSLICNEFVPVVPSSYLSVGLGPLGRFVYGSLPPRAWHRPGPPVGRVVSLVPWSPAVTVGSTGLSLVTE